MHDTGFEVRHEENLREHYAKTLAAWCANLDAHWGEAVQEVGQGTARVWRLYMAGSRLGFDRNDIELHQVLGVGCAPTALGHAAAARLGAAPGASRLSYRTGRVSRSAAADRPLPAHHPLTLTSRMPEMHFSSIYGCFPFSVNVASYRIDSVGRHNH